MPETEKLTSVYARLPDSLKAKLDEDAARQSRTTANMVRLIIAKHYAEDTELSA